jgi:adenylate cyclase, class 2
LRSKAGAYSITYKGPKIDATTKTRREIDLPLATDEAGLLSWRRLLETLGFAAVGEVRKKRRKVHVAWQGRSIEVSLDEVERLDQFIELELIADQEEIAFAKAYVESLAEALGLRLEASERRSYLELVLARH